MRPFTLLRSTLMILALASATALPACSKKADSITAADATPENTVTEKHDAATTGWAVSPDGKVRVTIKAPASETVAPDATGTVTTKTAGGSASAPVKLEFDKNAGLYTATIPRLEADVTELSYEISLKGKTLKGTLHLPRGGTDELLATGKASASKLPKDKKGPNGGVVQVVGGDVIEIAADKNGEVRVYLLDDDMKSIPVGKRRVKLAVGGEIVELNVDAKGVYFTGKLSVKVNPSKLTVVFYGEGSSSPVVVLCGWAPGTVIVANQPTINLFVVNTWPTVVVVNQPTTTTVVVQKGKGRGKKKGHYKH